MRIILFLVITGLFFSCDLDSAKGILPGSAGSHDEVLVVMSSEFWDKSPGDTLRHFFQEPYSVLPQPEPTLQLRQVNYEQFNDLFRKYRNILFVGSLDGTDKTSEYIRTSLGAENVEKVKTRSGDFFMVTKENVWAKPQRIVLLFAADSESLVPVIAARNRAVIKKFLEWELDKYASVMYMNGENHELSKTLAEDFGLRFKVPAGFRLATQEPDFLWLRNDTEESILNLIFSIRPGGESLITSEALVWRNEIGRQFISSEKEDSFMITDTLLGSIQRITVLGGLQCVETRGLWKMENDFMGGPFLNYVLYDNKRSRKIMMEGFVYAPGTGKKKLIRLLESSLHTVGVE